MYNVHVEGVFITGEKPNLVSHSFSEVFQLTPDEVTQGALSIIKGGPFDNRFPGGLIGVLLRNKYEGYKGYRTCGLVDVFPVDDKAHEECRPINVLKGEKVETMNRQELVTVANAEQLGIDTGSYESLLKLREDVNEAREDPKGFQAKLDAKRKADDNLKALLARNNLGAKPASTAPMKKQAESASQPAPKPKPLTEKARKAKIAAAARRRRAEKKAASGSKLGAMRKDPNEVHTIKVDTASDPLSGLEGDK